MCLRRRLLVAASAVVLLSISGIGPASADPIGDKQRQVRQIADKIERLGDQAADLGEQYNSAVITLQRAESDVKDAEAKLSEFESKLSSVRTAASGFALRAYMYANQMSGVGSLLAGSSVSDGSAQRQGYNIVALGNTTEVTDDMKTLIEDADRQKTVLESKRAQQAQLAQYTKDRQKAAEAAQAKQSQVLVKVKGELSTLVQQEQKRREEEAARQAALEKQRAEAALLAAQQAQQAQAAQAAQARQAAAAQTSAAAKAPAGGGAAARPPATAPVARDDPPAAQPEIAVPSTSPGAAIAVRAALSQLGVPYRFAAASPGEAFDCSGLTMWAWAQAGVSLPHGSRDQYYMFPKVPQDQLQPGDLVFFNSSSTGPLGHVGIYIGNGQMVSAPRTGDVVKVSSISGRSYAGAARP
jgi:cell wall-associated NlpC family hydrolase